MSPAERREKEREERVRGKKGKGIGEKRTGKLANGKLVNGMGEEAILLKEGVEEGELLAFKFKGEEWDSCVASDD